MTVTDCCLSFHLRFGAPCADECARQYDLPVLKGVDVVAYWTLPDGAEPVIGTPNLMASYGEYRFFFSSIVNLRAFEVFNEESVRGSRGAAVKNTCSLRVAPLGPRLRDTRLEMLVRPLC